MYAATEIQPTRKLRRLTAAAVLLAAALAPPPAALAARAAGSETYTIVQLISDTGGQLGLAPGRYKLVPSEPNVPFGAAVEMELRPAAAGSEVRPVRFRVETEGCAAVAAPAWDGRAASLRPRPDGSRELRVPARQDRRCALVGRTTAASDLVSPPPVEDPPPPPPVLVPKEKEPKPIPPKNPGDPGPVPADPDDGG